MTEPKVIGVFKFSHFGPRVGSFYKLTPNDREKLRRQYLYENGLMRLLTNKDWWINVAEGSNLTNNGPVHPDDWYWNENEKRMIEVATLSEDEYLNVTMSDAIRITISEWDDSYIECPTEVEALCHRWEARRIESELKRPQDKGL